MNTKTIITKAENTLTNIFEKMFFSKTAEKSINILLFVFSALFIARLLFGFIFGK